MGLLERFTADPVRRYVSIVAAVNEWEPSLVALDDEALRRASLALRHRARCGEPTERLRPEAFALVREASRRTLGMRHFDVQLLAGIALSAGRVAEMQTGEGKTLTAALPLYLHALTGKGSRLATANDYLAERDAAVIARPLKILGLSTGLILGETSPADRRTAYRADVVYGTVKEFGFDLLRDRLSADARRFATLLDSGRRGRDGDESLQRPPYFLLVDEADALCIDEADVPLVIGTMSREEDAAVEAAYRWAALIVGQFTEETHYEIRGVAKRIELTFAGRALTRSLVTDHSAARLAPAELFEYVERAVRIERDFHRDRQYVVEGDEILIIDPNTGRASIGRRWQDGLHEAIEAREGLPVQLGTGRAAQVTVQNLLSQYPLLAGMTGTTAGAERELRRVYRLQTSRIPTHRPSQRTPLPTLIFGTDEAKWQAIVEEVRSESASGRPVLVATRSIERSEHVASLLRTVGVRPRVLHAREVAREAEIIAEAGTHGAVTVATNMAGRGTDIRLGPGVAELGGLHVVCTEFYDSPRLDRQQIGRAARQGDPGSHRTFAALDDELLQEAFDERIAERLRLTGLAEPDGRFDRHLSYFVRAQRLIEKRRARRRKLLTLREREHAGSCEQMGIDPYLDAA